MNIFQQCAYGMAAANVLAFHDNSHTNAVRYYREYQRVLQAVNAGNEPDNCDLPKAMADCAWTDIVADINCGAESILRSLNLLFSWCKTGIVESAINCSLDSDMNQLDLQQMIDLGYVISSGNPPSTASSDSCCPICLDSNISGGACDFEAGTVSQDMLCTTCGASWTDRYRFDAVLLDTPSPVAETAA